MKKYMHSDIPLGECLVFHRPLYILRLYILPIVHNPLYIRFFFTFYHACQTNSPTKCGSKFRGSKIEPRKVPHAFEKPHIALVGDANDYSAYLGVQELTGLLS